MHAIFRIWLSPPGLPGSKQLTWKQWCFSAIRPSECFITHAIKEMIVGELTTKCRWETFSFHISYIRTEIMVGAPWWFIFVSSREVENMRATCIFYSTLRIIWAWIDKLFVCNNSNQQRNCAAFPLISRLHSCNPFRSHFRKSPFATISHPCTMVDLYQNEWTVPVKKQSPVWSVKIT